MKINRFLLLCAAPLAAAVFGCAPVEPVGRGRLYNAPRRGADEISVGEGRDLRVLIARDAGALKLAAPGGIRLVAEPGGQEVYRLQPGQKARLRVRDGRLCGDDGDFEAKRVRVLPLKQGDTVTASGRHYRGSLTLEVTGGKPVLVNTVDLEDYLVGVVSSEVPAKWPLESLKAQAVAARTYALARSQGRAKEPWDLDDTTASQAYAGAHVENEPAARAVRQTAGKVLFFGGKLAETYFHSNCGGRTADAGRVWSGSSPYLRGVACGFCNNGKHHAWEATLDCAEAGRKLAAAGLAPKGDLTGIEPLDEDHGRAYTFTLRTTGGKASAKASAVRNALGADVLRSTRFEAEFRGGRVSFKGLGWGHGIGLCQEGAQGMAEEGYDCAHILAHYYPGTVLKKY